MNNLPLADGTPAAARPDPSLTAVLASLSAGVAVVVGSDRRLVMANDSFIAQLGDRTADLTSSLTGADGDVFFVQMLEAVYQTGRPLDAYDVLAHEHGSATAEPTYLRVSCQPLLGADGGVQGAVIHSVDTTELVRARGQVEELGHTLESERARFGAAIKQLLEQGLVPEGVEREMEKHQALVDAQASLDRVFDAAGDAIWVLDAEGSTTLLNPAAQQLTGWEPADIVGKVSHFVIHHTRADGSPYPIEECPIYRSVFFGEPCDVDDEVFWRKDGTSFPVSYRSTPIYSGGRHMGAVQIFRDLTGEREAQAEERRIRETRMSRQKAFELNDTVVQRLAVADLAYKLGRPEQAAAAVSEALSLAKRIIDEWGRDDGADLTRSPTTHDEP